MRQQPKRIIVMNCNDIYESGGSYYIRGEFIPRALGAAFELQRDPNGVTVDGDFFPYEINDGSVYNDLSQVQKWITYVETATPIFIKKLAKVGYDVEITTSRKIVNPGELVKALIAQLNSRNNTRYKDEFKVPKFILPNQREEEE